MSTYDTGNPIVAWAVRSALDVVSLGPPAMGRHARFLVNQHQFGNFRQPESFSEKINWRILNDRRELLADTCDKLRSKELARAAGVAAPETIWAGTELAELTAVDLPSRWVLKPNHSSGQVHYGAGQVNDLEALRRLTKGWLGPSVAVRSGEWAYTRARPMFLVEERLGEGEEAPPDYKFFVFDGQVAVVAVEVNRMTDWARRMYTPEWQPLTVRLGLGVHIRKLAPTQPAPDNLGQLLATASRLGGPFDFVRVDLYNVHDEIQFGELTPYPGSGLARFWPRSYDYELGARWTLPKLKA